jgi:neutral ceramidase
MWLMTGAMLLGAAAACGGDAAWKVGLARESITPPRPVVLLGYGDRTGPFESVAEEIYAKALALEDRRGQRAVIVTADLVGFQAAVVTNEVCRRIQEKTGLPRRQLLFNASHTHTGPLVSLDPWAQANSVAHAPLTVGDVRETVAYTEDLREKLVQLVCDALARLEPARLAWGMGQVDFPTSRRLPQGGRIVMSDNLAGTTDRAVPVLRVESPDGRLRAVLFGCACHNTALTGRDNVIAGDYAGFAQQHIEGQHPQVQAMFMSGCGADANPSPRGSFQIARRHGAALGSEVCRVLDAPLQPIQAALTTGYREVDLPLQALSRTELETRAGLPSAEAVMARHMLGELDRGQTLPTTYRAPLAVWQFGDDLTLVALPAEPVADYVSLLGRKLGRDKLWVAGFNNDCFGYLPTAQVVREGGHEAIGITLWIWGRNLGRNAGFFAPEVEQAVLNNVRELADEVGRPLPDAAPIAADLPSRIKIEKNVRIPLRDGITLAADVYRPDAEERFPALLQVSYYVTGPGPAEFLVPRGYVCVLANSRGRGGSQGEWDPYVNEPNDGFDAQQWVGQQPWCTGKVGTFGQSYNAFTQIMSAPLANPHLVCMVPVEGQQSFFGHQYNDGVLQLNVVFTHGLFAIGATGLQGHIPIDDPHFRQLPLMSAADQVPHPQAQRIKEWMRHARYDEHWRAFSVKDKYDRIQAPAYFVTGWYDNLVHENFRNLRGFRAQGGSQQVRRGTRLRVGPGRARRQSSPGSGILAVVRLLAQRRAHRESAAKRRCGSL